jgi:uncharacterized membrane protein HdeD (DUF308 family)
MWLRGLPGLIICALGVVWLLQGVDVLHGSSMTGHHQYAVLGAVAIVLGAVLLVWAERARRRRVSTPGS